MLFKKGNIPWNKGKKGLRRKIYTNKGWFKKGISHGYGFKKGQSGFKKGHIPWNKGKGGNVDLEKVRLKNRNYKLRHPEIIKMRKLLWNAKSLNGDKLTIKLVQQVYEDNIKKYGTLTCYLCLQPIIFSKDVLEHKIPLSRGGMNTYDNLDIACKNCNCKKWKRTEEEYRNKRQLPLLISNQVAL